MFFNQHQHESYCMTIIGNFRREAIQAEQLRLAREGRKARNFVNPLASSIRQATLQEKATPTALIRVPSETSMMS